MGSPVKHIPPRFCRRPYGHRSRSQVVRACATWPGYLVVSDRTPRKFLQPKAGQDLRGLQLCAMGMSGPPDGANESDATGSEINRSLALHWRATWAADRVADKP